MRQRLRCIIRKEFRQVLRNPQMRAMLVLPPLIQLLVFRVCGEPGRKPCADRVDGRGSYPGEPGVIVAV